MGVHVDLLLDPPFEAGDVRTRRVHPSQELAPLPNGGVRLSMDIGDLTEVGTWILGFGGLATVISPEERLNSASLTTAVDATWSFAGSP